MLDVPTSDPGRYAGEIAIMQEMGWSWQELRAAPYDLVDEIAHRMAAKAKYQAERRKKDEALAKAKGNGRKS